MKTKTNNPQGRPKGTGNVLISTIREQVRNGISANDAVSTMFKKLEEIKDPVKYCQTLISIFDIVLPKLQPEQSEPAVSTDWYAEQARKMMEKVQ